MVVTGASSGLGRALELARRGALVVLATRRRDLLVEVARRCGPHASVVKTDLTNAEDVENLARLAGRWSAC